jgi:hypothetical protein
MMVDRAEIFSDLTKRNAIRRAAKLPPIDVRAEFDHAVAVAEWREACNRHVADIRRIKNEVIAELRSSRGQDFGHSVGGHWLINHAVTQRFIALLAAEGVRRPTPRHEISYGMDQVGG